MLILLPLILTLVACGLVALTGWRRPAWTPPLAILSAALTFVAVLYAWLSGGGSVSLDWAPAWGLRLAFSLDGLAALYALLASGIGTLILVYSSGYLPRHLQHEGRSEIENTRFYALILLFMAAMIGLVMAQDLVLLFIFWDLTAITSYYLIGFDRWKGESRRAALLALLVTGISAILFLLGIVLLSLEYQTFSLPLILSAAKPGPILDWAVGLIAIGALAKSAQAPLHFWLPRAMAAPTPVSAYLHSAAMVAAGVFAISRFYDLFHLSSLLPGILVAVGLSSMLVGGILALTAAAFKQVLAYSTIAQYGYVVYLLGLDGEYGPVAAAFYVLAHGLIKSGLFMTAGAVTEATGAEELGQVSGIARRMPALALASGVLAAGLAGFPLTLGFFKDELFFEAAHQAGVLFTAAAVGNAALTFAYTWRFWNRIFLGPLSADVHSLPRQMTGAVALLAVLVFAGGWFPGPFAALAEAAGRIMNPNTPPLQLAYHLDLRTVNLLALSVYTLAAILILSRPLWRGAAQAVSRAGQLAGPERMTEAGLHRLNRLSDSISGFELRNLADRLTSILLPAALLLGAGLLATPSLRAFNFQPVNREELLLGLTLIVTGLSALLVAIPRNHLTQILSLSAVSAGLTVVMALMGAPNPALVSVLVGAISTFFFFGIYLLYPVNVLKLLSQELALPARFRRQTFVGFLSGVFAFFVTWSTLSQTPNRESVADEFVRLTEAAHAQNTVTAILADFRGFDTVGEVTVVIVVMLGVTVLLGKGKTE